MNLQQFKTEIFTDINDLPRAATAEQASNGSDTINRVNGLIDAIEPKINSIPEYWGDAEIFLHLTTGDDGNNGLSQATALASVEAVTNLIASKTIDKKSTVVIVGTLPFNAQFNLQNIQANRGAKLIFKAGNNPAIFTWNGASNDQPIINIPPELIIDISSIVFIIF